VASADIVIGGGGIIGLSTAIELAGTGLRVRVLERGRAMAEASWAAAGMLAAEDPENPEELSPLAGLSRDLYPNYLRRIEHLSGHCVPVRTRNALQATRRGGSFHCSETATRRPISAESAREKVGSLAAEGRSFLWLEEWSLDPRDLCAALPPAAANAGVIIDEKAEIRSVRWKRGGIEIESSSGTLSAGIFVNCCGAWAAGVMPEAPDEQAREAAAQPIVEPIVEPRKGQMLTIRLEDPQELACVVRTPEIYLVPRGDGRVVIGATVERAGFDREIDHASLDRLRMQAAEIWPPAAQAPVVERWTGLRPGTADDLPVIGPAGGPGGDGNYWLATGHFRNGILLAPATAAVLAQMIRGERPAVSLEAFAPDRGVSR
jgi:glycine oxidase